MINQFSNSQVAAISLTCFLCGLYFGALLVVLVDAYLEKGGRKK